MRWAQSGQTYGNPKWHLVDGVGTEAIRFGVPTTYFNSACEDQPVPLRKATLLPEDRRPGLARNNVCMRCKKAYLVTRPDLQALFDKLNDKKDV